MQVLHVIDGLGTGGAERSLTQLLPLLERSGISSRVRFFHQRVEGVEDLIRRQGVDVRQLQGDVLFQKWLTLRHEIRSDPPDLLHSTIFSSNVATRVANRGRIPLLNSLVSILYEGPRTLMPGVSKAKLQAARLLDATTARLWTTHFHANSEAVKRASVRALGIKEEQVTVIPRGRDPESLIRRNDEIKKEVCVELDLDPRVPIILAVGRHEYAKGHELLLRATRRLIDSGVDDCKVLIAGREGATTPVLHDEVRRLDLARYVRFLGHRNDVNRLMGAADVFVLPSRWEGSPGALIEAMGSGLPIVAFDLEPVLELVEHEVSAIIVPAGSVEGLALAIGHLITDRQAGESLAENALDRFLKNFTLDSVADRMMDLYRRVATTRGS